MIYQKEIFSLWTCHHSSVKRATFYFFGLSFQNSGVDCNIIPALSNVTSLELVSPSAYEDVVSNVLIRSFPRCKTFSNLKYLKLGECFLRDGCYPLLFLLRRSPNIEKLHLQLNKGVSQLVYSCQLMRMRTRTRKRMRKRMAEMMMSRRPRLGRHLFLSMVLGRLVCGARPVENTYQLRNGWVGHPIQ